MTESDFLRAICRNPADDLPRLMLADWLEEQAGDVECPAKCFDIGNGIYCVRSEKHAGTMGKRCPTCSGSGRVSDGRRERAEFIRCQIEIANQGECTSAYCCQQGYDQCRTCKHYEALRKRERELWDTYKFDWFGGDRWAILCLEHERGGELEDLSYAFVTRGFVSEVRAPLASLIGGPCERCAGDGGWLSGCTGCDGSGTIPGIASRLIGVQPVERWVATDKRPCGAGNSDWGWYGTIEGASGLPLDVWCKLKSAWGHDSEASALADLSQAIDRIAREQAGKQKQPAATAG